MTDLTSSQFPIDMVQVQRVLDAIEEPYWIWNIANDTVYYSSELMGLLGYPNEPLLKDRAFWKSHVDAETLSHIESLIDQHLHQHINSIKTSCQVLTKFGDIKWVDLVGKIISMKDDRAQHMFGLVRDISELKQLVNKLKKQNDYLTVAEQLGHSGYWRLDLIQHSLYWSLGVYNIYGLDPLEFTPSFESVCQRFNPNHREKIKQLIEEVQLTKKGFHVKTSIQNKLGEYIKVELFAEVELTPEGEVKSLFGIYRDISKEERRLEKLKLLALVNKTINVPIFFIDEHDNVVYQELTHQQDHKSSVLFNYINFSISEYLAFKKLAKDEGKIVKKNATFDNFNTVFDFSVTYEPNEGIYIWIVEDVTEQFKKQQQQAISNRLALLGNTFGNVSHDINNVLGVALGSIEMLELKLMQGEQDIQKYVDRVKNAIDKGKSVTERLLAFTRKPKVDVTEFDPIKDIKDNQYLFEQLLLTTIKLDLQIDVPDCTIKFPKGEFINILLNIVLNAQDAIQEQGVSGTIAISVHLTASNKLAIDIKDSGTGIKEENLTKIFDPFYSSKSVNKGNGIGLANVYDTMYKHNGEILVEGKCDLGGAHFTLIFPCKLGHQQVNQLDQRIKNGLQDKRVLVLDDEISIGEFVTAYLEKVGAKPICISSKQELLSVLEQKPALDVFITDMILPDLSGREAVNLVTAQYPDIKVFSISGYIAVEESSWEYPVLRKPFNSEELASFLAQ